jgi:hypothetical protein
MTTRTTNAASVTAAARKFQNARAIVAAMRTRRTMEIVRSRRRKSEIDCFRRSSRSR